jgi:hypothetical protein
MAIKAGIGISDKPNAFEAGIEAASQAIEEAGSPKVLLVFSSTKYDQQQLIKGINNTAKGVPVIGCSSAGEITTFGPTRGTVVIMALASDSVDFTIGLGSQISKSSRQAGRELARNIKSDAKSKISALLVFSDILTGNGDEILKGIQEVFSEKLFIAGCAAGDDFLFKETYVYYKDKFVPASLAGLSLSGKYTIGVGVRHGWVPIGLPVKVTKSHGAVVDELEGKPAVEFYVEHFGMSVEDLMKETFAQLAITYPLGRNIETNDEPLIRYPIDINSQGGIRFTAGIPEGSSVRLMLGSREEAIKATEEAAKIALTQLKEKPVKAAIVFDNIARDKLLAQHAPEEIEKIKELIGDNVPLVGCYTYGEFAPNIKKNAPDICFFHNETMTVVLLAD